VAPQAEPAGPAVDRERLYLFFRVDVRHKLVGEGADSGGHGIKMEFPRVPAGQFTGRFQPPVAFVTAVTPEKAAEEHLRQGVAIQASKGKALGVFRLRFLLEPHAEPFMEEEFRRI
jgi:hypothetical protein